MALSVDEVMRMGPVIPVLVLDDVVDAAPLASSLVSGGVRVLEVTLRTDAGLDAIREMSRVDGAIVGAGTVLNTRQFDQAMEAGARFIVSPGLREGLARAALDAKVPFLPGVATGSEIMHGLDLGLTRFKFFPAESSGGAAAVSAFSGPFREVVFCPTGGVSPGNAASYLALPNVACVGGSWLTPKSAVAAKDWSRLATLAAEASALRR